MGLVSASSAAGVCAAGAPAPSFTRPTMASVGTGASLMRRGVSEAPATPNPSFSLASFRPLRQP